VYGDAVTSIHSKDEIVHLEEEILNMSRDGDERIESVDFDHAVKMYYDVPLFNEEKNLDSEEIERSITDSNYKWVVPIKNPTLEKEAHLYIGGPTNSLEIENKVKQGYLTKEEGEKLIQSKGKWTVAYVSAYEKNKHSIVKVAQEVIARENLNVEKILFVVPKELQIPVVLIKVDGEYQVMFHEFLLIEGGISNVKGELSLDQFYPFNKAKEIVREFIRVHQLVSTNGDARPNGVVVPWEEYSIAVVGIVVAGFVLYKLFRKKRAQPKRGNP
jgi:acetoin utilization protein